MTGWPRLQHDLSTYYWKTTKLFFTDKVKTNSKITFTLKTDKERLMIAEVISKKFEISEPSDKFLQTGSKFAKDTL